MLTGIRLVTMSTTRMVKIKIWSTNVKVLDDFVGKITDIVKKTGVKMNGPIPLPTKN